MSEDNVEIVRRAFEAATRRDAATVLALYDPDVEIDPRGPLAHLIGAGIYRGVEGVRRFYRAYNEAWRQIDYDVEELIDAGDHVVSVVKNRLRGRGSGVEVERDIPAVWTVREGKILRVVFYATREDALEAAGLKR